jgi:hypothetical protein
VGKTYPRSHHRIRAALYPLIKWGEDKCVRCGHILADGDRVALEHDAARRHYEGWSHLGPCRECQVRCSSSHGGTLGQLAQREARQVTPAPDGRAW